MTLDASGRLGIGATSLNSTLTVRGDNGSSVSSILRVRDTNSTPRTTRIQLEDYSGALADGLIDFKIPTAGDASSAILQLGVNSAAMTLNAGGNLLVGTTSAAYPAAGRGLIELNGSSDSLLALKRGDTNNFYIHNYSSGIDVWNTANTFIRFATNATERVRLTAEGRLCVGDTATTNNANLKLKTTTATSNIAYFDCAQTDPYGLQVRFTAAAPNGTGNEFVACYDEVGSLVLRASIRSNGGLANFSANNVNLASDERLKKDISPLDSAWGKVKEMEVVNFRYKDCNEGDPLLYGVIAQQVQPIVPELVVVTQEAKEAVAAKDAVLDEEGNVVEPAVEAKEAPLSEK
jgi:hypothetical protein